MSYIPNYVSRSSSSPTLVVPSKNDLLCPPLLVESTAKTLMSHLPLGMTLLSTLLNSSGSASSSRGSKQLKHKPKATPLAKDGQNIAKFFNVVAGRPYPSFGRLEQSIRVVDTYTDSGAFATSTTVPTFFSLFFLLNQFAGYTNYTALFDQYRIDQIEVWLEPTAAQGSTVFGTLVTAVDLDDAASPGSLVAIEDKQGALVGDGSSGRYHCFRPHVAVAEYSGTFASFGNLPSTFIDSASPAVQHYGYKVAAGPTPAVISYNITVRAVMTFRSPGL